MQCASNTVAFSICVRFSGLSAIRRYNLFIFLNGCLSSLTVETEHNHTKHKISNVTHIPVVY